jgi:3-phenylpropionate/trans-cinnamate dioxygenase ferredoxin reductase subunit
MTDQLATDAEFGPGPSTIVVVGGGHAAAAVVFQLRSRGYQGALCLISSEPHLPYHRPPLSKKALGDTVDPAAIAIRPATWYAEQNVQLRLDTEVLSIDRAHRKIALRASGESSYLDFDALVLATGVAPRPWAAPDGGGDPLGPGQGVYTLRDVADAQLLGAALRGAHRLVVVGGGYIGLEVAASAQRMGLQVTVVEQAPRILARVAPHPTAEALKAVHSQNGVDVIEGAKVEGMERRADGRVTGLLCRDSAGALRTLPADLVVVGIGGIPRDALARGCGLEVDNGIVVNDAGRTSDASIWALGDVARVRGSQVRLESVASANEQAAHVAAALLGQAPMAPGVPWFWSEQYDGRLQIAGLWNGSDRWVTRREAAGWSVWSFRDDRLQAVDAWQAPLAYALGRQWLESGRTPDPHWLEDLGNQLKDWKAHLVKGCDK